MSRIVWHVCRIENISAAGRKDKMSMRTSVERSRRACIERGSGDIHNGNWLLIGLYRIGIGTIDTTVGGDRFGVYGAYTMGATNAT